MDALTAMEEMQAQAGEILVPKVIGTAVLTVLKEGQTLSLDLLIQALANIASTSQDPVQARLAKQSIEIIQSLPCTALGNKSE